MQGLGQLIYAGLPSRRSRSTFRFEGCDRRKPVASRRKRLATREISQADRRTASTLPSPKDPCNRAAHTLSNAHPGDRPRRGDRGRRLAGARMPTGIWPCSAILLGFSIFSD